METNLEKNTSNPFISIDSYKTRIFLDQVKTINKDIDIPVFKVKGDEIIKEFKEKSYTVELKGCSVRFAKVQQQHKGSVYNYLTILVNSKIHQSKKYLQGIHNSNIKDIYNNIIACNIVYFSFKELLNSECTDVDFKLDSEILDSNMFFEYLKRNAKPSTQAKRGFTCENKDNHKAMYFSDRKYATPSNPFLKFYQKSLELKYNSTEFADHFNIVPPANLFRLEFTIKNKKHFKKFGIENTKLENLLSLSQEKLNEIKESILSSHLDSVITSKTMESKSEKLKAMDKLLFASIQLHISQNLTRTQIFDSLLSLSDTKQEKHRLKLKLDSIWDNHIMDTEEGKKCDVFSTQILAFGLK